MSRLILPLRWIVGQRLGLNWSRLSRLPLRLCRLLKLRGLLLGESRLPLDLRRLDWLSWLNRLDRLSRLRAVLLSEIPLAGVLPLTRILLISLGWVWPGLALSRILTGELALTLSLALALVLSRLIRLIHLKPLRRLIGGRCVGRSEPLRLIKRSALVLIVVFVFHRSSSWVLLSVSRRKRLGSVIVRE